MPQVKYMWPDVGIQPTSVSSASHHGKMRFELFIYDNCIWSRETWWPHPTPRELIIETHRTNKNRILFQRAREEPTKSEPF